MPQRPEDYMSTKNVGGSRKGGTDATSGDPFGYLKIGPNHSYLGHFTRAKFLEEGHNERRPKLPTADRNLGRKLTDTSPTHAVVRGVARPIDVIGRKAAAAAIRGGDVNVARERPVLAARLAAKTERRGLRAEGASAAAIRQNRRALRDVVSSARKGAESRRSERAVRRRTS